MKSIAALLIAISLAACGGATLPPLPGGKPSLTMDLARTYTGAGEQKCQAAHRWQECRNSLTPAEAAGGSE